MDERRKFPRFSLGVEVQWKKVPRAEERTARHISQVKDISLGGVCLVLHPDIQAGDILQMEIRLPGKPAIEAKGRVAWVNPQARVQGWAEKVCEGGIEFFDLSEGARKEINHFIYYSAHDSSRK